MKKIKQIVKWYKMLTGKSVLHVKQNKGKIYNICILEGYYNDLTEKVRLTTNINEDGIPFNITTDNNIVIFPIAVFQYALGLYDMYLLTKEIEYKEQFILCSNWIVKNQETQGSWDNFGVIGITSFGKYSAMAQGEAVSVLVRAYVCTKQEVFLNSAKKGIDFMLVDIKEGGVCNNSSDNLVFEEYIGNNTKTVLNGWIFSLFGLYDFYLATKENEYLMNFNKSVKSLSKTLDLYDTGYWSKYDNHRNIASPFYHNLHIALLEVLGEISGDSILISKALRFKKYQKNPLFNTIAFSRKVFQKLIERSDIVLDR